MKGMRSVMLSGVVALAALVGATGPGCAEGTIVDETSTGTGTPPLEEQITPAPGGARRLLARQYQRAVRQVLGEEAAAAVAPPIDIKLHGFASVGATELAMSPVDVEAYETSARAVAKAVTSDPVKLASLLPCQPLNPGDSACYASIAGTFGRKLWRRALEPSESGAIAAIGVKAGGVYMSAPKGVAYVLSALLQAPEFLYVVEVGEPIDGDEARRRLTPLELATRMSLFLVDAPPDDALLDLAESGGLDDEAGIRSAATELLARDEARSTLEAFYDEVFRFERLDETVKTADRFPEWTPELKGSIHASIHAFLEDLVWNENADARTMLTATHAFVDANLAPLYGVSVPAGSGLVKVELPAEQQRAGLLGSAAFLSIYSHASMSSPTKRGVFMRRTLLCDSVPPPPAEVVPKLPDDPADGLTTKELLEQHMKDDNCKSCHSLFDSLGWSLEKFDPVGRFRTIEKGKPIDTSGESPNIGSFAGPKELAGLLAEHYQVPDCMVRNLYRDATGHLETDGEEPALEDLHRRFEEKGFRVQELLVELVASPAFRMVGEPR